MYDQLLHREHYSTFFQRRASSSDSELYMEGEENTRVSTTLYTFHLQRPTHTLTSVSFVPIQQWPAVRASRGATADAPQM